MAGPYRGPVKLPDAVLGATWQAGVTPNNSSLRPFIDGEPEPLCFAANVREGWAKVYVRNREGGIVHVAGDGSDAEVRMRYGRIALIACRNE